jgi:hypothetical protein
MNRVYLFFTLPLIFLLSAGVECQSEFEVKQNDKGKNGDYSITLKLKQGASANYELELQDLNTGKFVTKKTEYFGTGDSKVVFEGVKPSIYTVYFTSSDCPKKKSIKGTGIVLQ